MSTLRDRTARLVVLGIVVLASVAVYVNSLAGGFVWDDRKLIVDDRAIKSWSDLGEIFTHDFFERNEDDLPYGYYRPVTTISYLIDFSTWRMRPFGYHLTNVLLHAGCSAAGVLLLLQLGWSLPAAAIAGLLFAVHPIHTENVAWIAGRTDLLAFLFGTATLLLDRVAFDSTARRRWLFGGLALGTFMAALLAKEMAVVVIAWLGLVYRFDQRRPWPAVLTRLAPYLGMFVAYWVWRFNILHIRLPGSPAEHALANLLLSLPWTLSRYLTRLVLPIELNAYIQNPYVTSLSDRRLWVGVATLVGLVFVGEQLHRRSPHGWLALLMLLVAFGPLMNLARVAAPADMGNVMAERFCYFPSLPFSALVGLGAAAALRHAALRSARRTATAAFLVAVLAAASVRTVRRDRDWRDELTFLTATLRQSPSATLLWGNLATYHLGKHELQAAAQAIERAEALDADSYSVLSSRALWYVENDHPERAIPLQERIVKESRAGRAAATNNLAYLYRVTGRNQEALALLEPLLQSGNAQADMYYNFAEIQRSRGNADAAREGFAKALAERPDELRIASSSAAFEMAQGRPEAAAVIYEHLLRIYPDDARVLNNLALLRHRGGDTPRALDLLKRAIDEQPDYLTARLNYAQLLDEGGKEQEATHHFEEIVKLDPGSEAGRAARRELASQRRRHDSGSGNRRQPATPQTVVLVTVDTLRADTASGRGEDAATMPFLQTLASEGVRFNQAYAPSSWTVPSMASLFTGLMPGAHGVVHGTVSNGQVVSQETLADSLTTLAELFQSAGYVTIGVPSNAHLAAQLGFAQGFDHYSSAEFKIATDVNREIETQMTAAFGPNWARTWKQSPVLLWFHYFDPHAPYEPHSPWVDRYMPEPPMPLAELPKGTMPQDLRPAFAVHPDATREYARALYRSEASFVDASFRAIAEKLGLRDDDVLLIVTADHGEELADHGDWGHSHTLYEELIKVPLVVRWPAVLPRGQQTDTPVSLIDLYPTLIELARLPATASGQGDSLAALLRGQTPTADHPIYAELHAPRPPLNSVRDGRWKLIRRTGLKGSLELFDLQTDGSEQRNVADENADVLARLDHSLADWKKQMPAPPADQTHLAIEEEETKERLRALGYLP